MLEERSAILAGCAERGAKEGLAQMTNLGALVLRRR